MCSRLELEGSITDAGMANLRSLKKLESLRVLDHTYGSVVRELSKPTMLAFQNAPLPGACQFLEDLHGIPVSFDRAGIRAMTRQRPEDLAKWMPAAHFHVAIGAQ